MEHLTFSEASMFLGVLKNILVHRGTVEIIVPNMTFHINQWIHLKNDKRYFDHAKAGFWGWQRKATTENYWDVHKSGYDAETMKEFITKAGFTDFVSHNSASSAHLHVTFRK
jgi:predicted SAM-dependent methyltransferase